jgi:RimJ/RimL family protein N-acetyltransferase
MTEAVQTVVRYTFENIDLNRLFAYQMMRNPTSGRVLEKNDFKQEGLLMLRS